MHSPPSHPTTYRAASRRLAAVVFTLGLALLLEISAQTPAQPQAPVPPLPLPESLPKLPLPALPAKPKASQPPSAKVPKASDVTNEKPAVIDMTKVMPPPDKTTAQPPQNPNPQRSSTSASGQFVVHGADLATRSAITTRCEDIAREITSLLRDPKPWGVPIVISIHTAPDIVPSEPAVTTDIRQLDHGGFHLQVVVQVRPDFSYNDLRIELIRMLIAERIIRDHKALTTTRQRILPEWILTGVREAMNYRARSRPSTLFAAIYRSGKVYGITEILESDPGKLDALSRAIYEASSCALILTLLDQAEGNLRFAQLLSALAKESKTDRQLLNQVYPSIAATDSSLDKWWSLQMASLATPSIFENLGPADTAKELNEALVFRFSDEVETESPAAPLASTSKAEAPAPEPRTGILRWWFKKNDSTDKSTGANEEESKKQEAKSNTDEAISKPVAKDKDQPQDEPKPSGGLLSGLFRRDKKDSAEPAAPKGNDKPKADAPAPKATKPEPKNKPIEEVKPEEKSKPGGILRNLFRRDKKEAPEPDADAKDKAKDASVFALPSLQETFALALPNLALFTDLIAPSLPSTINLQPSTSAPHPIAIKLFGRKDSDTDKAEQDKKAADKQKLKDLEAAEKTAKADAAKAKKEADAKAKLAAEATAKKEELEAKAKKEQDKAAEAKPAVSKPQETPAPTPPPATRPAKRTVTTTLPIDEYAKVLKRPDAKRILDQSARNLAALLPRAHPLFRPVIKEYIAILTALQEKKTKGLDERLTALKAAKAKALETAKAVQDHLDFYEAGQSSGYSGLFDDYLRIPQTVREELPKRTDPISEALDEAERKK